MVDDNESIRIVVVSSTNRIHRLVVSTTLLPDDCLWLLRIPVYCTIRTVQVPGIPVLLSPYQHTYVGSRTVSTYQVQKDLFIRVLRHYYRYCTTPRIDKSPSCNLLSHVHLAIYQSAEVVVYIKKLKMVPVIIEVGRGRHF